MSTMYAMKPFGGDDLVVKPADILYKLPSYHGEDGTASVSNSQVQHQSSPSSSVNNSKSLDLKEYIKKVVEATNQLSISMKKFVAEESKRSKANTASLGASFQPPSKKKLQFELQEGFSRAAAQFHYKLARYEPISDRKFEVHAGPKYHDVMKLLHQVAGNRSKNVTFRDVTTDGVYVETTTSDGQKVTIKSSVASLLLIGEALGLYSYRDIHLAGSGEWLARIDDALHGRTCISHLVRESSQHLGALDLFSKSHSVSMVDIVYYSALRNISMLPNNTEMFVKRVAEAISSA